MSDSLQPQNAACQASLSITNSWSLLKLMSIELVMPSNHLMLCFPLLLPPSIFPSIRVFSNESALSIKWPKYWSFSFSINPSNKYSGLISLRMDWLDLFGVQGTLSEVVTGTQNYKANNRVKIIMYWIQIKNPTMRKNTTCNEERKKKPIKIDSEILQRKKMSEDIKKVMITIFYLHKEVEKILNVLEIWKIYKRYKLNL